MNEFIRSKGENVKVNFKDGEAVVPAEFLNVRAATDDGIVKTDVGVTIPESISYNPQLEVKTVTDLKKFTNIFRRPQEAVNILFLKSNCSFEYCG